MRRTDLEAAKTTCGLTVPTHCHADNWWRVQKFQLLVLAPPHAEQGVYETGLAAGGAARKLLLAQSLVCSHLPTISSVSVFCRADVLRVTRIPQSQHLNFERLYWRH